MNLKEYKDKAMIKFAKQKIFDVINNLRLEINIEKENQIKKGTYKHRTAFSNFIVGSGKHGIILFDDDVKNSQQKFDIDYQIVISQKVFRNKFDLKPENAYEYFSEKLKTLFNKQGFQLDTFTHKALKFYSQNSKYNFSFEIVLLINNNEKNKETLKEIVKNKIYDKENFILNEIKNYNIHKKLKEANQINRKGLIDKYIFKRNFDNERAHFLLLLEACNEVSNHY